MFIAEQQRILEQQRLEEIRKSEEEEKAHEEREIKRIIARHNVIIAQGKLLEGQKRTMQLMRGRRYGYAAI